MHYAHVKKLFGHLLELLPAQLTQRLAEEGSDGIQTGQTTELMAHAGMRSYLDAAADC